MLGLPSELMHHFGLLSHKLGEPIDFVIHSLIHFEAGKRQKGKAIVVKDLTLRKLAHCGQLEIQLRGDLFVNEQLEDVYIEFIIVSKITYLTQGGMGIAQVWSRSPPLLLSIHFLSFSLRSLRVSRLTAPRRHCLGSR